MPWSLIQIALLISAERSKHVISYEGWKHQEKSNWRNFGSETEHGKIFSCVLSAARTAKRRLRFRRTLCPCHFSSHRTGHARYWSALAFALAVPHFWDH